MVPYAFAANLSPFFCLKMKCLQPKLLLVAKSIFVFPGVLTDITLESESNSAYAVIEGTKNNSMCSVQTKMFRLPFFAERP